MQAIILSFKVLEAHFFSCLCKWRNDEAFERRRRATERELKRKLEEETGEVEQSKNLLSEIQDQQVSFNFTLY